ncbi:MAG: hypothetical protein ACREKF_09580 [Candidatus Methylomirabilales bacterium]
MTLGQAAITWLLHQPATVTVLPETCNEHPLTEFAAAPAKPDFTPGEPRQTADLSACNFHLVPAPSTA